MRERDLNPPEPKTPPSGDATIYVERPIPLVGEHLELEGFGEFAVLVTFDEGSVHRSIVFDEDTGLELGPLELTADERETAEVNWSEDCAAYPDERDDGDRDMDR